MSTDVNTILGMVFSTIDRMGVLPYVGAFMTIAVAGALIVMIKRMRE
jgi:hypothetical protein